MYTFKHTLRTASSERFLTLREDREVAAVELHYLPDGHIAGTVILLEDAGWMDGAIPLLLREFDEDMLPGVDLSHGTLSYTVAQGKIVGNYGASEQEHRDGRTGPRR